MFWEKDNSGCYHVFENTVISHFENKHNYIAFFGKILHHVGVTLN